MALVNLVHERSPRTTAAPPSAPTAATSLRLRPGPPADFPRCPGSHRPRPCGHHRRSAGLMGEGHPPPRRRPASPRPTARVARHGRDGAQRKSGLTLGVSEELRSFNSQLGVLVARCRSHQLFLPCDKMPRNRSLRRATSWLLGTNASLLYTRQTGCSCRQ